MRLTIITINYNSSENTINLLESLKNQTDKDFEVMVVDNNSNDVEKLMNYQTSETNIIYIKNDRNLGYSGGNNVGIKKALNPPPPERVDGGGADWVLLLNNDIWVESGFIERLRADLDSKDGIIGLALDEGERTAFGGLIQWLKPTLKHVYDSRLAMSLITDIASRYYAIGGAMLIHKSIFDKIGFLDENYFLYFEDADFCQRARKAGIPISFLSTELLGRLKHGQETTPRKIKIFHSVSASTKKLGSPLLLRYHYRNALYFNLKNGSWNIKLLTWPWSWLIIVKQIIKIIIGKNKEQSFAILKGVGDWYSGKMGKLHD